MTVVLTSVISRNYLLRIDNGTDYRIRANEMKLRFRQTYDFVCMCLPADFSTKGTIRDDRKL